MPSRCMAPGCKVGSRSYIGPKRIVFRNPKHLYEKWLQAVPRQWEVLPKVVFVCQNHFLSSEIMFKNHNASPSEIKLADGENPGQPSLVPGAVPSVFNNSQPVTQLAQPNHHPAHEGAVKIETAQQPKPPSSSTPKKRKKTEKPVAKTDPSAATLQNAAPAAAPLLDVDKITSFEHLRSSLELLHRVRTCGEMWQLEWDPPTGQWLSKMTEIFAGVLDHWEIQCKPDTVCLFILQRKDRMRLTHSVDFHGSLIPQIWISDMRIKDIPEIVSWSALRDLLRVCETGEQLVALANAGAVMVVS